MQQTGVGDVQTSRSQTLTMAILDNLIYALIVGLAFYLLQRFTFGLHFTFVQCAFTALVLRIANPVGAG